MHGDRKRLTLALSLADPGRKKPRTSPKSALIRLGLAKRKVPVEDVGEASSPSSSSSSPQILNVWSCTEANTCTVLQPGLGEITIEGPVVKAEPGEEQEEELEEQEEVEEDHEEEEQDESHEEEEEEQKGGFGLSIGTVLSESMISGQLLELIDASLLGDKEELLGGKGELLGGREVEEQLQQLGEPEEQQPTNYNEPVEPEEPSPGFSLSPSLVLGEVARLRPVRWAHLTDLNRNKLTLYRLY